MSGGSNQNTAWVATSWATHFWGLSLSNSSSLGAPWVCSLEDTPSGSSAIRWIRQNSQCLKVKRLSVRLKGTVARERFFWPFLQKMTKQNLIFLYVSSAIRWIRQNSQCLKVKGFCVRLKGTVARERFWPFLQKMTKQNLIFLYMCLDFGRYKTKFIF